MVRRVTKSETPQSSRPRAQTPEERENQLIAAAVDLAEKQIREGKASSQVITHYLKLGSSREKLEQEKLRGENSLLITKKELMESEARQESLIKDALEAMRSYTGSVPIEEIKDDEGF